MAGFTLRRIVTSSTSTPYCLGNGSTAASTSPFAVGNKGVEVFIQNQSTGAFDIYVGGSDVAIVIGATSTAAGASTGAVKLAQNGTFSIGNHGSASAVVLDEWFVCSTSSMAVAQVLLLRSV